jgi:DnaK suppressor protein
MFVDLLSSRLPVARGIECSVNDYQGMIVAKTSAKKTRKIKAPQSRKPVVRKPAAKAAKAHARTKAAPAAKARAAVTKRAPVRPRSVQTEKPGSAGPDHPAFKPLAASPLKPKDLEYFRDALLSKRRELLGDVASMEQEALRSTTGSNLSNLPIHMADMGTDNYEQEFTLDLVEKDRQMLREIYMALDKIKNGTYGICEATGKPISRARLEAKPWARYSLEYMMRLEKGLVRR